MCGGLPCRLETSSVGSVSDDVSRCYGDGSSSLLGDQLQTELVSRLEIQQQTSTTTMFHQFVADAQRHVSIVVVIIKLYAMVLSVLSVWSSVCRLKRVQKTQFPQKNKQFRATVSIDNQYEVLRGLSFCFILFLTNLLTYLLPTAHPCDCMT